MLTSATVIALAGLGFGNARSAPFTEVTQLGAGASICLVWADLNGDDALDAVVGNYFAQANPVYWGDGTGVFTAGPTLGNGNTFAVSAADFDNDGDLDVAVGNGSNQQNWLYLNDGAGGFTQQLEFGTSSTVAFAWGDADNDGDLDLAVGNGILGAAQQNYLYRNNGDGTFTQELQFGIHQSCTLAWGDADGDGDLDLAVGNGGFGTVDQNYLYRNDGDGTFTEEAQFGTGDTASLAWGDADNDGDLDLAVGNWDGGQNYLYENLGDGTFTEHAQFGLRDPNTVSWGDADNDGDLDLAVGNGDFSSADQNYLYRNEGGLSFTELPEFGLGSTDGICWADVDGDGDLDLGAVNEHTPTTNYLYRNDGAVAEWIDVHLVGRRAELGDGYSNRDGIGAKISVYSAGGLGDPGARLGYREVSATGGFTCELPFTQHFGVPGRAQVDLRIEWPGSGGTQLVQDLTGVDTGARVVVVEGQASSSVPGGSIGEATLWLGGAAPNPSRGDFSVAFGLEQEAPVRLGLFDASGRLVTMLSNRRWSAGIHRVEAGAEGGVPGAGVYYLRLDAGGRQRTSKIVIAP